MAETFRVTVPPAEADRLREWARWAATRGLRDQFIRALRILQDRLAHEPRDPWSEEFYDLRALRLQLRFSAEDMLDVAFGVHHVDPMVFVRQFHWLGPRNQPRPPNA